MLEFPIYSLKEKDYIIHVLLILMSLIVVLYLLFPSIDYSLLFIPLVLFVIYEALKENKNISIGKIYLTSHQLKITSKQHNFQVNLNEIDNFELTYSGYRRQRMQGDIIGPFNTFSGIDNYIAFKKEGVVFKCRFGVDNSKQESELFSLIKYWEMLGYNTSNIRINK